MKEAIIAMCLHDTKENGRHELTKQCLKSLNETVNERHTVYLIDNGSDDPEVWDTLMYYAEKNINWKVLSLPENIGTARGINQAIRARQKGQHVVKMDNDVVIHKKDWVEDMIEAIEREPKIGVIGLKRVDLWEEPSHPNPDYRSELVMLPHLMGQYWIVIEKVHHCIGTCQMYNSALLDRIGYLWQPSLYGYDDVLMSHRSSVAGFWNCFLPHIKIEHIDPGGTPYADWKHKESGGVTMEVVKIAQGYYKGTHDIFYDFY